MYAPTSTNSPRSGPTSGDDDALTDFDGAGEILRAWGNGLRPDPDLTVSEWADRHRMLSGRASSVRYQRAWCSRIQLRSTKPLHIAWKAPTMPMVPM